MCGGATYIRYVTSIFYSLGVQKAEKSWRNLWKTSLENFKKTFVVMFPTNWWLALLTVNYGHLGWIGTMGVLVRDIEDTYLLATLNCIKRNCSVLSKAIVLLEWSSIFFCNILVDNIWAATNKNRGYGTKLRFFLF